MLRLEERDDAVRFPVRVQPRASRSEIVGEHDGALRIRSAAPPVAGAANRELIRLLARRLGVPRGAVRLITGERGRDKVVEIAGVSAAAVSEALGG